MDVSDFRTGTTKHKDEVANRCQKLFQDFLEEFRNEDGELKYLEACTDLQKMERNCLEVSFEDVFTFNQYLGSAVADEYYRVYPYLCQAVKNIVKDRTGQDIKKECYVGFVEYPNHTNLRKVTSDEIGKLVKITGQVIRTRPVHVELVTGVFKCPDCGTVRRNVEQQFKFTFPPICRNNMCNNRSKFELLKDESKFSDFQKLKIQEIQTELPHGCTPKSLDVIIRGELSGSVGGGGVYNFVGTLIVIPDVGVLAAPGLRPELKNRFKGPAEGISDGVTGLKALGVRNLNYRVAFLACSVQSVDARWNEDIMDSESWTPEAIKSQLDEEELESIYKMSKDKDLHHNLAESLFPWIYGHSQVKKGLVLMLLGGVPKKTAEGTTLRGNINCCIVGDPSTAKTQFLERVSKFCPRAKYTSGKASTAAGLTAAVIKDEESNDYVIEAGAVLLADNGICCIDEFDKMDVRDQVAIHEVMEQQSISIAKAGVRATLKARTAILAAANPLSGHYDKTKSLQQNINLSPPIMSRFDLFFVLVDEGDPIVDLAIAEKILSTRFKNPEFVNKVYTDEELENYINFAKQFNPIINEEAEKLLVDVYTKLRVKDTQSASKNTWRVTVRQLESLIRLSEAMAKMECSDQVKPNHVKNAHQLLNKLIMRPEQPDVRLDDVEADDNLDGLDGVEPNDDPDDPPVPETLDSRTDENEAPQVNGNIGNHIMRKKKQVLKFEEYKSITNTLILYMKQEEDKRFSEAADGVFEGIRQSDIINAYLELISNQIESEEELIEKKELIEKIINRLTYHDQILIPLSTGQTHSEDIQAEDEDPLLVVHPDYVPEL